MLIFLPLLLASLFRYDGQTIQSITEQSTTSPLVKSVTETIPISKDTLSAFESGILSTCAITSAVLLLMGLGGRLFVMRNEPDRKKKSYPNSADAEKPQVKQITFSTLHSIFGRILSVALPFYATARLGTSRVTLIMLIALATNLMAIDGKGVDLKSIKGWKRLLLRQRWSLSSILLQVGCDFVGLTNQSGVSAAWMGYVALGISIAALPPPFPSSKPKSSAVTSTAVQPRSAGSAILAKPDVVNATDITLSPLICTAEDTKLTLIAGGLLTILSCAIFLGFEGGADALHPEPLGWFIISVCATLLSYTFAQPQSIRNGKGLGLALGALLCTLLSTVLHHDLWTSFAHQGVFIGISIAATKQDTQSVFSTSTHSHHDHHTHHHPETLDTSHHSQPSRFSEALLRLFQHWPLLHSILAEKDSRRIFYFMRWSAKHLTSCFSR